jgi:hypothetical protein
MKRQLRRALFAALGDKINKIEKQGNIISNKFATDPSSFQTKCFPDPRKPFIPLPFVTKISLIH